MSGKMFCYQCQETAGCKGCTLQGVCGKTPEVAGAQDVLVYATKGLSEVAVRLRAQGADIPAAVNHLITTNLFATITNANFDEDAINARVRTTIEEKDSLLSQLKDKAGLSDAALWDGGDIAPDAKIGVLST